MAQQPADPIKTEDILTGLSELGLAQGALAPSAAGAWAAELGPPTAVTGPRIFSVQDRQVCIATEDTPLYVVARKWIQNLPEEHPPPPEPASIQLPGLLKPETQEPPAPAPVYDDGMTRENMIPDLALSLMKNHWVSVRKHWQKIGKERMRRQQARIAPWLQAVPMPAAAPAPQTTTAAAIAATAALNQDLLSSMTGLAAPNVLQSLALPR